MDHRDRQAIEDLFDRLREVERRAAPRDPEAEAFIRSEIVQQPAAPYYMAQTIVVQEQALEAAQARIAELEGTAGRGPWGGRGREPVPQQPAYDRGYGGGGFLAGAAQTALGVAGGVMLGSFLGGLFGGGSAEASESGGDDGGGDGGDLGDAGDFGGDFGGDF